MKSGNSISWLQPVSGMKLPPWAHQHCLTDCKAGPKSDKECFRAAVRPNGDTACFRAACNKNPVPCLAGPFHKRICGIDFVPKAGFFPKMHSPLPVLECQNTVSGFISSNLGEMAGLIGANGL